MSIRSTIFKRKFRQLRSKNPTAEVTVLLPFSRVKSDGHTTIFGQTDSMDEDGNPMKAGKRYPGRATGKTGTEPITEHRASVLRRTVRA